MTSHQKQPDIFLSMPHACSYLPDRTATTMFIDPRYPLDTQRYGHFTRLGFRRSGDLIYRPHCAECQACIPVRIPVQQFQPNRGQRRVWKRNQDLAVTRREPGFSREHFALYLRYQQTRHAGGGMDDPNPQKYVDFLLSRQLETTFFEMRLARRLIGVAVADHLPDGLSAVYTFFDPKEKARGIGVFAVLWEIEQARQARLPWVYLGYWIKESPKMNYKKDFRPLEVYRSGRWSKLPSD
jgi:leucyl-tRNA---protein transferase